MNESKLAMSLILFWSNSYLARRYNIASGKVEDRTNGELSHLLGWKHGGWPVELSVGLAGACTLALKNMNTDINSLSDRAIESDDSTKIIAEMEKILSEMEEVEGLLEYISG